MKYSVVMLIEDRQDDFNDYLKLLREVLAGTGQPFEVLVIANGTGAYVRKTIVPASTLPLGILEFSRKTSHAVCLKGALEECAGEVFIVCGSYQQITRDSIVRMLEALDVKTDIVSPWRRHRVDPPLNQFQSRLFNALVARFTQTPLHDLSCTIRVIRRKVLEETELYGGRYRFLPILAARKGFVTRELDCEHHQERGKVGLYSIREYVERVVDILALYFTVSFARKPLRFFGLKGLAFFAAGGLVFSFILLKKVLFGDPIGDSSVLILSLIAMVVGVQIWSIGLLGEILAFTFGRRKKECVIETII